MKSTEAFIYIQWKEPWDNGGCPITSYSIERNAGDNNVVFTSVFTSTNPSLWLYNITTFPASSEGKIFLVRIVAHNAEYSTSSSIESMKLAGVP